MVPSLYGFAWPKAARHGAGTNIVAPSTPAPHPTRRRRVTLPLYQNSFDPSWSFQSIAIVFPPDFSVPIENVIHAAAAHRHNRWAATRPAHRPRIGTTIWGPDTSHWGQVTAMVPVCGRGRTKTDVGPI